LPEFELGITIVTDDLQFGKGSNVKRGTFRTAFRARAFNDHCSYAIEFLPWYFDTHAVTSGYSHNHRLLVDLERSGIPHLPVWVSKSSFHRLSKDQADRSLLPPFCLKIIAYLENKNTRTSRMLLGEETIASSFCCRPFSFQFSWQLSSS
jgi:hypothetical protein